MTCPLREQSAQDACDVLESLAVPLALTLPTRTHDLPKTVLSAGKGRLEANWDVINAWFGELRLKSWETLNGCTPFFRGFRFLACCWLLARSVALGHDVTDVV